MNAPLRRISRFWLDGGHLTDPSPEPEPEPEAKPIRYCYAYEADQHGEAHVHRFISNDKRWIWVMEYPGRRGTLKAADPLVVKAKERDNWPMEGG